MADDEELEAKIKDQLEELNRLQSSTKEMQDDLRILEEQRDRIKKQEEQKTKELNERKQQNENIPGKHLKAGRATISDAERKQKEARDRIREKVTELVLGEENHNNQEAENEELLLFKTLIVRYIPDVKDGDIDSFDKADPQEATFHLSKDTTFRQLKQTACQFWNIEDEANMGLRASNYALLNLYMDQNVYKIILSLRMPPEFFLFQINKMAEKTFTELKDCFLDSGVAENFNKTQPKKREEVKSTGYKRQLHKKIMEKVKGVYKGLESYESKPINLSTDQVEQARTKGQQGGFITCLILFTILFITIILLIVRRDVTEDSRIQSGVNYEITQNQTFSFFSIKNKDQISDYLAGVLGPAVFNTNSTANASLSRFYMASDLRVRQVRTNNMTCPKANKFNLTIECYEPFYTDSTRNTSNLTNSNATTYQVYNPPSNSYTFDGEINNYDSSGYYEDFDKNLNLEEFQSKMYEMMDTGWLDNATRAVFISFNMFLPNRKKFVNVLLLVEINVMGLAYPSKASGMVLISNFYSGTATDKAMLALEVIRLVLSFYFLYLYIFRGMSKDEDGKMKLYNWFTIKNVANLFLVVLILVAFSYSFMVTTNEGDILQEGYYDLNYLAYYYITCININLWVLLFLFFRLIEVFKFSTTMNLYLHTLDLASKNLIYYLVILLPLLLSLSLLTMQMYGPFDFYYRSFKYVVISNLLFSIGNGEITDYLAITQAWTIAFLFVYIFVMVFYLYSAYLGILIDSYRISELRQLNLTKAMAADPGYKPWKIWLSNSFARCKRKHEEKPESSQADDD